jgi:hypothetical protein
MAPGKQNTANQQCFQENIYINWFIVELEGFPSGCCAG